MRPLMLKFAVTVALLAAFGCATGGKGPTPKAVVLAGEQSLTVTNRIAREYVRLPLCTAANKPVCSDAAVSAGIKQKSKTAYDAVIAAQAAVDADPAASKTQTAASLAAMNAALAAFVAVTPAPGK